MDMDGMSMGIPWLDQPVQLHSSRASTCSLTAEQCSYRNYKWHFWYVADWTYALPTIGFLLAVIVLFTTVRVISHAAPRRLRESKLGELTVATTRFLIYKAYHVPRLDYYSPSLGVIAVGALGFIFFSTMTLVPQPYYWPQLHEGSYGGSPPLATRAGWMALALLPFVIALPMKLNLITQVTGVPHEKLQIFHRWCAWAMFILALIHTFPFIIIHIQVKHDMEEEWRTDSAYWTGVVAILAQAWLQGFSLKVIRDRFYEIFKATHLVAAVVFVVFFFLHCDFRLSSWDYFIATAVVYVLPTSLAWLRTVKEHGLRTATLTPLPDASVLVQMPAPSQVATWAPAQHMFVRFLLPSVHALAAHPFTITSSPRSNTIQFIIRSKGGFTARLHSMAVQRPGRKVKVLLDGPYGGIQGRKLSTFHNLVVVAGGSGAGLTLPVLEDALRGWRNVDPELREEKEGLLDQISRQLTLVLSTRSSETSEWYIERVKQILDAYTDPSGADIPPPRTRIEVHVTGAAQRQLLAEHRQSGTSNSESTNSDAEHTDAMNPQSGLHTFRRPQSNPKLLLSSPDETAHPWLRSGRPDIPTLVRDIVRAAAGGSTGIVACGPTGMLFDVKSAAAEAQVGVIRNGTGEVWLHAEAFDW